MALSVGFGRITNDPEAPIRTRKALGRLATPGLLVTDKGLTIDTNGRMVLRLNDGLYEDSDGLSVKLAPDGGLTATDDGLALSDSGGSDTEFGDITVDSITVLGSATINVNANVAGNVNVDGIITGASANIVGNVNSVGVISTSVNTSTIISDTITSDTGTFDTIVVGVFTPDSLDVVGHATVGGDLTITGNVATAGDVFFNANATVYGNTSLLSDVTVVGILSTGSLATGAITCTTVTSSGNATVGGVATITGNATVAASVAIGTTTITAKLSALATTEQLRLLYNTSNYCRFTVASNGATTIQTVGGSAGLILQPQSLATSVVGNFAVSGSSTFTGYASFGNNLNVNGNVTIGGNLTVTGTINGGGGGGGDYTRMISVLATVYVNPVANGTSDDYVTVPGAVYGDTVVCTPLGLPPVSISWCAATVGTNLIVIRTMRGLTPGAANVTFRITVIGFT